MCNFLIFYYDITKAGQNLGSLDSWVGVGPLLDLQLWAQRESVSPALRNSEIITVLRPKLGNMAFWKWVSGSSVPSTCLGSSADMWIPHIEKGYLFRFRSDPSSLQVQ